MSLIFISIAVGIAAVGLLWADHHIIRKVEDSELDRPLMIKLFLLGFVSSYIGGSLINVGETNIVTKTIENLTDTMSDSIKIGRPTF